MNNYANWEVTLLLPIENTISEESGSMWIVYNINDKSEKFRQTDYYEPTYDENYLVRQCYSWEDIRLYLLSQEIEFFIDTYYGYDKKQYYFKVEIGKYGTDAYEYYDSEVHDWLFDDYEQAREEAIKYCLTKIKNG